MAFDLPASSYSPNEATIRSYESAIVEYVQGTPAEVPDSFKEWILGTLRLLSPGAKIIEIGSGFGRDAEYIESFGFQVERTDATDGFIALLKEKGCQVRKFNILTDPFTSQYDLVFADAVFLHFTRDELQRTLKKVHAALHPGGILSFSVKKGEGEAWSMSKINKPRYFCFWSEMQLRSLLQDAGFETLQILEEPIFLQVIAKRVSLN
jgi:predicted TPR repeat methyltransferase